MAIEIRGLKTKLAEIDEADAEEICLLRNNELINKYLSTSEPVSVKQQQAWILENLRKNDGFYLKIIDLEGNEFCGTASIYNVKNKEAEFGRYICTKSLQAVETEYLMLEYAFDAMSLDRIYCRTAELNSKVWKQHIRYGFSDVGTEIFHNKDKELKLKVQEITSDTFRQKDYSFIRRIIQKF